MVKVREEELATSAVTGCCARGSDRGRVRQFGDDERDGTDRGAVSAGDHEFVAELRPRRRDRRGQDLRRARVRVDGEQPVTVGRDYRGCGRPGRRHRRLSRGGERGSDRAQGGDRDWRPACGRRAGSGTVPLHDLGAVAAAARDGRHGGRRPPHAQRVQLDRLVGCGVGHAEPVVGPRRHVDPDRGRPQHRDRSRGDGDDRRRSVRRPSSPRSAGAGTGAAAVTCADANANAGTGAAITRTAAAVAGTDASTTAGTRATATRTGATTAGASATATGTGATTADTGAATTGTTTAAAGADDHSQRQDR